VIFTPDKEALHKNINRDSYRELATDVAEERIVYGMRVPGRSPRLRELIALACREDYYERQRIARAEHEGRRI
jgi:hypothetical protein